MNHEPGTVFTLTYRYSPELRRRSTRREFWRTQRLRLLELVGLFALFIGGSLLLRVWWVASFFAGMALSFAALLYSEYRRVTVGPPAEGDITATLTEAGLRFSLDGHSSEISWRALSELRRTPEGLVLRSRLGIRPVLLPAAVVTPEVDAFVGRCFAESRSADKAMTGRMRP
jgi:hypothetical protein